MAKYHGKKGLVYLSTTGSGNAASVGALNAWTYDRSVDTVETTSFGDANKTYVQGLPDSRGTFGGFYDDTITSVFTGAGSSDGVKVYLYPSSDALTKYFYGPAWTSYSVATGISQAVTIGGNFVANGSWGSF